MCETVVEVHVSNMRQPESVELKHQGACFQKRKRPPHDVRTASVQVDLRDLAMMMMMMAKYFYRGSIGELVAGSLAVLKGHLL